MSRSPQQKNGSPRYARARVRTPEARPIDHEWLIGEDRLEPCAIIIIGASGDLTARKLIPALYDLFRKGGLPDRFFIVGCARTEMDDAIFRDRMSRAVSTGADPDLSEWEDFAPLLHYRPLTYDDPDSFSSLRQDLEDLDHRYGTTGNRLYYLAVPPALYSDVAGMLGRSGLSRQAESRWSRIVVEKPFGRDLESATELNRALHGHFEEEQIFRIDHYLAKETVQNILIFRFANAIFEPVWNRRYIDYVSIIAAETLGVEHRAGYYEQAGVLRDMFQNHMMQLMSLTAMEPPSCFEADRVRDEKVKSYRALRPFPVENLWDFLILGQYGAGSVNGTPVPAYREEEGVDSASLMPTFAMMKVYLDNWRWQGIPFYLTSGKRLAKKMTAIAIQFKKVPHSMFRDTVGVDISANRLTLGIHPEEKITLTFQTKTPGGRLRLRTVTMDFFYHNNYEGPVLDAYEKVLLDCMLGDHMLFWRQDGVELCWSFLTPILRECEACGDRAAMLLPYPAGTWGPEPAEKLVRQVSKAV